MSAVIQTMACHDTGDTPLPEPIMTRFADTYCVTIHQCVNARLLNCYVSCNWNLENDVPFPPFFFFYISIDLKNPVEKNFSSDPGKGLSLDGWHAIARTNADPVHLRIFPHQARMCQPVKIHSTLFCNFELKLDSDVSLHWYFISTDPEKKKKIVVSISDNGFPQNWWQFVAWPNNDSSFQYWSWQSDWQWHQWFKQRLVTRQETCHCLNQ